MRSEVGSGVKCNYKWVDNVYNEYTDEYVVICEIIEGNIGTYTHTYVRMNTLIYIDID